MKFVLPGLGVLAAASLFASCITGNFQRNIMERPLLERAQTSLPQTGVGLEGCLELLGAPSLVFEHEVHGLLLVYAWNHQRQWGLNLSVPTGDSGNASFNFSDIEQNQEGVVLWLDADWQLSKWEHGFLRSLIGAEPRPATIEQLESS